MATTPRPASPNTKIHGMPKTSSISIQTMETSAAWPKSGCTASSTRNTAKAAWAAFAVFLVLLAVQPDFGQAALVSMVWMLMLLVFGIPWIFVFGLAGLGVVAIVAAYFTVPHVTSRIDRFLSPE